MLHKNWPAVAFIQQEGRLWHVADRQPRGQGVVFSAPTRDAVVQALRDRQYEINLDSGDWICRAPPQPAPVRRKPGRSSRPPRTSWETDGPVV